MTAERAAHGRHVWKRATAKYSRWLHIYGSMLSFAVVFFFAATGITLNHPDWFAAVERPSQLTGTLDPKWTDTGSADVAKLEIVEAFRSRHQIAGTLSELRVDDSQITVSFRGPGYGADAFVDRKTGKYDLTENRMGFVAVINDLHKGRDTGSPWKWLIDVSAALLVFVSLTGLILIYFIHKHRFAGVVLLVLGGVVCYGVYWMLVP